jgi:uncharacterized repeat protein (TIGR01451 family)
MREPRGALLRTCAVLAVASFGFGGPARSQELRLPEKGPIGPIPVFVELTGPPATDSWAAATRSGGLRDAASRARATAASTSQVDANMAEQARLAPRLAALGAREIYRVQRVLNGIAVMAAPGSLDALRKLPGVRSVRPIQLEVPTNSTSVPFLGIPQIWENSLGLSTAAKGEGIRIGIIDTGIDYMHASFGGTGVLADYQAGATNTTNWTVPGTAGQPGAFPTAKVVGGYDFAGNAYTGSNTPVPDAVPMDCNGHGSHVAGTAAGFGVNADGTPFTGPFDSTADFAGLRIGPGAAPQASLYALRVFGCTGSTSLTPKALEWATDPNGDGDLSDHLDVVNMSLGSPFGGVSDSSTLAAENAARAGIIVVASAGNSGDTYFITGAPGVASRTLSVAASADSGLPGAVLVVNSPAAIAGSLAAQNAAFTPAQPAPSGQTGDVVLWVDATAPVNDGCQAPTVPVTGKIVLVNRGLCNFINKAAAAEAAGAIGIIVANNVPGDPSLITMPGAGFTVTIPALFISTADGATLKAELASGVNVTFGAANAGDTIASFSARGPRMGSPLQLKPDVTAPGLNITSVQTGVTCLTGNCMTSDASGYVAGSLPLTISGTSMAAPHMAGIMALLRQVHPDWTVEQLKALAMNYATQKVSIGANGSGFEIGPGRVGAGRTQPPASATGKVIAFAAEDPSLVSVTFDGDVPAGAALTRSKRVRVQNNGTTAATYTLGIDTKVDAPGVDFLLPGGTALAVPAGQSVDVQVDMTADPALLDHVREGSVAALQSDPWLGAQPRHWLTEEAAYLNLSAGGQVALRVPLYASVRPQSTMAAASTIATGGAGTGSTTLALSGSGVCTGTLAGASCTGTFPNDVVSLASPFELQVVSPPDPVNAPPSADIQYAGVAYDATRGLIAFGVSTYGNWSTPTETSVNVYVDNNSDGTWDRIVFSANTGALASLLVASTSGTDVFASTVLDLDTYDVYSSSSSRYLNRARADIIDTNVYNSNVAFLSATPSQLGLTMTTSFRYKIVTCPGFAPLCAELNGFQYDEAAGPYTWDRAAQGLDFGGVTLAPDLDGATLPVTWNTTNLTARGSLGGLVLHHHNVDGSRAQVVTLEGSGVATGDLGVTLTASNTTPAEGEIVTFTIVASNAGTTPVANVRVMVVAPSTLEFLHSDGPFDPATGVWPVGPLGVGKSATLEVSVKVRDTGVSVVSASVSAPTPLDTNLTNNEAKILLGAHAEANLSVTATGTPSSVVVGRSLDYELTVANAGPNTATDVRVTHTLPSGSSFVSAIGSGWSCAHASGVVTCDRVTLDAGVTAPIQVQSKAPMAPAGSITSTATVSAWEADPVSSNNSTTVTTSLLTDGSFFSVTPCRLIDTRTTPLGTYAGPALSPGVERLIPVFGQCGVPTTAKAVALNVTVVAPEGLGFVSLYPGVGTPPGVSTINFGTDQTRANNAVMGLPSTGLLGAVASISRGTVQLIVDVSGYFE